MSQTPLISVVIPTRNRAHLLRSAIQSVLWQTFDDYEVIVSNNCSADNTAEIAREVGGERIRYVEPDRVLSMPDHWEFALDHVEGQYVAYLCDDDAWAPTALEKVSNLLTSESAQLVVLSSGVYYAPNWLDASLRNTAVFRPNTGAVIERSSEDALRRIYQSCRVLDDIPRMLNSFCHRETLERVRSKAGRLFLLCPDYSFAAMVNTAVPKWLYIDEPLHLQGVFPEGIGATQVFNRSGPAKEFAKEFRQERLLENVPLKMYVVSNLITETLLLSKKRLSELESCEIDWAQYFTSCWNDMMVLSRNGVDISADKEEFFLALETQPENVRERVVLEDSDTWEQLAAEWARKHQFRVVIRRTINSSGVLSRLESVIRGRVGNNNNSVVTEVSKIIQGETGGFNDLLECARLLPDLGRTVVPATAANSVSTKQ